MIRFEASFDDGCQLDLKVADLLEQYGIKDAIFYIPSDWARVNRLHGDIPLTKDELLELGKRFEIGSHTISHPMLTRISLDQATTEIVESQAELGLLFPGHYIRSFCYPRGYANDEIRRIVGQHYLTARNTLVGNLTPATNREELLWITPTVHVAGQRRKEYEGTHWLAEAHRLLKEAVHRSNAGEDVVYHFWGHSWEIDRYAAWGDFELLLMEIQKVRA